MEEPRFAQYLPAGGYLDWAFAREAQAGRRTRFVHLPDDEVLRNTWDLLGDTTTQRIAATCDRAETLEFIYQKADHDSGLAHALIKNPLLPHRLLVDLLDRHREHEGFLDSARESRTSEELGRLICDGFDFGAYTRQNITWLAAATATDSDGSLLERSLHVLDASYHHLLLHELLRQDPLACSFPVAGVLDAIAELDQSALNESFWAAAGQHVAARGTSRDIRTAIEAGKSVALCVTLLEQERISLTQALDTLKRHQYPDLLRRRSEQSPLTIVEAETVDTYRLPVNALHDLKFTADAALWAVTHGSDDIAGAAAWQLDSDAALVGALRRHESSHQWTRFHLRRAGRVWQRLSQRTRRSMANTFDGSVLLSLNILPLREWLISYGDAEQVRAMTLQRSELKLLLQRAESSKETAIAWTAAHLAERPRERVRMAEIALVGSGGEDLRKWVRAANSSEIVRLWNLAPENVKVELSDALVRSIRASDDTSWLRRLAGGLSIDWAVAPAAAQEAAAHYLSEHADSDELRYTIWTLYSQWTGTLEDLIAAARDL